MALPSTIYLMKGRYQPTSIIVLLFFVSSSNRTILIGLINYEINSLCCYLKETSFVSNFSSSTNKSVHHEIHLIIRSTKEYQDWKFPLGKNETKTENHVFQIFQRDKQMKILKYHVPFRSWILELGSICSQNADCLKKIDKHI